MLFKQINLIDFENISIIEDFRYKIYIEELKKSLPWANHNQRRLPDPDDCNALHLIYEEGLLKKKINGCLRIHLDAYYPEFVHQLLPVNISGEEIGKGCYVSKFMVSNSLRGIGTSRRILRYAYNYVISKHNITHQISHCNPKLVPYYERMGLRVFGKAFNDPYVGKQVPMVFVLHDRPHLKKVGSFLYRESLNYPENTEKLNKLKEKFEL